MTLERIPGLLGPGSPSDFFFEIARGSIPGLSIVNVFGRSPDIDTTVRDVWDLGQDYVFPTTARIHDIVSSNANDTSAGTGARTIEVFALDSNSDEFTELKTMNGTTNVPMDTAATRINRMVVRTAGTGESNAGDITATAQTDGTITSQISVGNNRSLSAIFTIPDSKTGFLMRYYGNPLRESAVGISIRLVARLPGEVFQLFHIQSSHSNSGGSNSGDFLAYPSAPGRTDVKIQEVSTSIDTIVVGGFDLILVDD